MGTKRDKRIAAALDQALGEGARSNVKKIPHPTDTRITGPSRRDRIRGILTDAVK